MFGFLKQKLADFSNKLKQTISKEETSKEEKEVIEKKEEKIVTKPKEKEPTKKIEEKKIIKEDKAKPQKKEETKQPQKEQKKIESIKEIKKEEKKPKEEIKVITEPKKAEEKKETDSKKEEAKPKGILGKIFGFGKKEEKKEPSEKETKPEKEIKQEPKEVLKKEVETKPIKIEEKIEIKEIKEEKLVAKEELADKIETKEEIEEEIEEAEEELIEEEHEEIQREEKPRDVYVPKVDEDKRELKANIGMGGGIKSMLFGGVEISEKQIEDLLFELELSLIESDVEQDAALELVNQIKQRIVGKKVSAKNIDQYLNEQIKEILTEMMKTEKINVLENVKEAKKKGEPYKILILGPNGAGKTTSIAKLVNYFQKNKLSCILAAGDTFRAGAIDQIEIHAKNLGVRVIKHQYGADPAAIAFDAISAAKAGKIDVVIIDSAGRQETNKNLMEELKKLQRVANPDLKIFVGESYVGQGLLDQVDEFEKIIGIDGYILTKMDTDAKGGTAISLTYKTKKPIIFIGTGQGYDDFEEFTPEYILNRII